jgi:hypothetical protein
LGGIAPVKQERLLRSCPPVIVATLHYITYSTQQGVGTPATPGRLWDLIRHGHKHVSDLEHLSFFLLDEADHMAQQVRDCRSCAFYHNL